MKTLNFKQHSFLLVIAAMTLFFGIYSCSSSKKLSIKREKVEKPFDKFYSDKKNFRAVGIQTSPDMSFALELAGTDARQKLAAQIKTLVRNVVQDYSGQYAKSSQLLVDRDFYAKMEALGYDIVEQEIYNALIKGDEVYKLTGPNGIVYEAYVALELNKDDFEEAYANGVRNLISNDDKLEIDFRLEQFKDTFEKQMEEFAKSQR